MSSSRGAGRPWASHLTSLGLRPLPWKKRGGLRRCPVKSKEGKSSTEASSPGSGCADRTSAAPSFEPDSGESWWWRRRRAEEGFGPPAGFLGPASKPPARALLTSRSGWARTRSPADCGSRTRRPSTSSGIAEAAGPAGPGRQRPPNPRAALRPPPPASGRPAPPRPAPTPPRVPPGNGVLRRRSPKRLRKSRAGSQGPVGNSYKPEGARLLRKGRWET